MIDHFEGSEQVEVVFLSGESHHAFLLLLELRVKTDHANRILTKALTKVFSSNNNIHMSRC